MFILMKLFPADIHLCVKSEKLVQWNTWNYLIINTEKDVIRPIIPNGIIFVHN